MDSSFIISPVSADFSDVWSGPQLLSAKGHNAIYAATRFGRKYVLKALAEPYRESTPHIELLRKEFTIGVGVDHPNIVRLIVSRTRTIYIFTDESIIYAISLAAYNLRIRLKASVRTSVCTALR